MTHKPPLIGAILLAAVLLVACGTSTGALHKIQIHTPLSCPCPTLAPLAQYVLPSEAQCCSQTGSFLGSMMTGPDGNLWVPEYDVGKIAQVTPSGSIAEFPIPTASAAPANITTGPDGALWFTEANFNVIGRITTAGKVTEFQLPPPFSTTPPNPIGGFTLWGIAAGPDGNLWFTDPGANVIGVMSTSGTLLATYPITTPNSDILWITKGPDNNMWFDDDATNQVGRITMTGVITEFPIPTPNSGPKNFVLGVDGNLWFPEISAGNVASVTMTGAITEYKMVADPTIHRLRRIAVLPDGSMWLTEAMVAPPWDSEIGKFNIAGVETDLWSVGGEPRAITAGPDGSPWFGDEANELVVRL